jgi:hypothetical protein
MRLAEVVPWDPRPLLAEERADLLVLLDVLGADDWAAATESGHWRVKDVALHLLDDDLGWLSRGRDHDLSGLLPTDGDYRDFVRSLDAKNERWVVAAAGLSPRVIVDLLAWSGREVDAFYATIDLDEGADVIWASADDVPRWFDLARDLTERWVHQQHIRDAVGRPGDHARFLPHVLRTFVWAYPHQYAAEAPPGTEVAIDLGAGGVWRLTRAGGAWELDEGATAAPAASLSIAATDAWRLLTGLPVQPDRVRTQGPTSLTEPLRAVRGIIA